VLSAAVVLSVSHVTLLHKLWNVDRPLNLRVRQRAIFFCEGTRPTGRYVALWRRSNKDGEFCSSSIKLLRREQRNAQKIESNSHVDITKTKFHSLCINIATDWTLDTKPFVYGLQSGFFSTVHVSLPKSLVILDKSWN